MNYQISVGDRSHEVSVRRDAQGAWWVAVDGQDEVRYTGAPIGRAEWRLTQGGVSRTVGIHLNGDHADVAVGGHSLQLSLRDPRAAGLDLGDADDAGQIITNMPGVVVRLLQKPGAQVKAGEVLLVVEAMKMENEFKAPCDGVLSTLHVEVGQAIEAHTLLATVTPEDGP